MSRELKSQRTEADYEALKTACRAGYDEIISFVSSEPFRTVYDEMMSLPSKERPKFVVDVFLNDAELKRRGVNRPASLLIQRSAFGDRRPTLFCVKKWLPRELHMFWENVNFTFDNEYEDGAIPRDETAWRPPLPVALQHEYLSGNMSDTDVEAVIEALKPATRLGL